VTIGVEFGSFACKLEEKIIKLQIWDTAGQESFRSITRIFYRGAHCVFLTYDITREDTFINVRDWLKEVKQHASSDIIIYLIGNRCDLEEDREVTKEKAIEFCRQYNIDKYFETSAKTGQQVEEVFSLAAKELYLQQKDQQNEEQEEESPAKNSEERDS
jgi:Ras-related protein Rab-2A